MEIKGEITGINYKVLLAEELEEIDLKNFNINHAPSTCILTYNKHLFALSKWVSPKRTRSYPYERVYNCLHISKKITIIPIVKDEGARGDRDFIQWDTVSLMSLLDIFVIFAYYDEATINVKNPQKITAQQFNNRYILSKIKQITRYHSSALHWNLNELDTNNLHKLIDKVKKSYHRIQEHTGVILHHLKGLDSFKEKIGEDVSNFISFSRDKAKQAQAREFVTKQPKESLSTLSKAKITISNYLGGKYFFTVDEVKIMSNRLELIESKHSSLSILPSKGDIKDGLLKMILYCNLKEVTINEKNIQSQAILKLTSPKLKGVISSQSLQGEWDHFMRENAFSIKQIDFIKKLFQEAGVNAFIIKIEGSK